MRRPVRDAVTENVLQEGLRTGRGRGYGNEGDRRARSEVPGERLRHFENEGTATETGKVATACAGLKKRFGRMERALIALE